MSYIVIYKNEPHENNNYGLLNFDFMNIIISLQLTTEKVLYFVICQTNVLRTECPWSI